MPYGFPDIEGFYDMLYGSEGIDLGAITCLYFGAASGVVWSGNPAYTATDFLGMYPKFFGVPTNFTGLNLIQGNPVVAIPSNLMAGLQVGQLVVNLNSLVKDTLIQSVNTQANTITLTVAPVQNDTVMTVFEAPLMPLVAILTFITLALNSVMQQRYQDSWLVAISLFVAHYCTLYMRTESGVPNVTASQVAASGLTKGVIIVRSAGDVSATSKVLEGYEEWGAWRETQYGELFITIARGVACGPIWVP